MTAEAWATRFLFPSAVPSALLRTGADRRYSKTEDEIK